MKKVLVVDDSPIERKRLCALVTDAGWSVETAKNGSEAIDLAQAGSPDLILLDVIMPDMDGYEACRALQRDVTTRSIPVVFVSSKNQKADFLWAKMQGARELVSKPYSDDEILGLLGRYS